MLRGQTAEGAHWRQHHRTQYAKGHKYLTLVYQIDIGVTRLLWIGKERTIESFQGFFTAMGKDVISKIAFICSDMWEPYLQLNGEEPIMRRKWPDTCFCWRPAALTS